MTVTLDQYREMVADRPRKFSAEEVNFHSAKVNEPICRGCIHWYAGAEHDTCEIMRPQDEYVPWNWTCMFQTKDGLHFPLYVEPAKEPVGEEHKEESLDSA